MRPDHEVREGHPQRAELDPGILPDLLLSPGALPSPRRALRHRLCRPAAHPTPPPRASGGQVPRPLLANVPLGPELVGLEPLHPGLRHHRRLTKCGTGESH